MKITIKSAEYIGEYKIKFIFSDGKNSIVDFYSFLSAKNQNPMSSKYLNKKLFTEFEIINHKDISWNNYEMCFQFSDLYKGGEITPTSNKVLKKVISNYFPKYKAEKLIAALV